MDKKMKVMFYVSAILTAVNLVLLTAQFSPAFARVAGMDYSDLRRDRDFRRAVEDVVEDCSVSGRSISC